MFMIVQQNIVLRFFFLWENAVLFLQEGGPTQITVRRHKRARVLAGLEPDYKPDQGEPAGAKLVL